MNASILFESKLNGRNCSFIATTLMEYEQSVMQAFSHSNVLAGAIMGTSITIPGGRRGIVNTNWVEDKSKTFERITISDYKNEEAEAKRKYTWTVELERIVDVDSPGWSKSKHIQFTGDFEHTVSTGASTLVEGFANSIVNMLESSFPYPLGAGSSWVADDTADEDEARICDFFQVVSTNIIITEVE